MQWASIISFETVWKIQLIHLINLQFVWLSLNVKLGTYVDFCRFEAIQLSLSQKVQSKQDFSDRNHTSSLMLWMLLLFAQSIAFSFFSNVDELFFHTQTFEQALWGIFSKTDKTAKQKLNFFNNWVACKKFDAWTAAYISPLALNENL